MSEQQETLFLAMLVKPFVLLVLTLGVLYPARRAVEKWMPEGRLKRFLLYRTN